MRSGSRSPPKSTPIGFSSESGPRSFTPYARRIRSNAGQIVRSTAARGARRHFNRRRIRTGRTDRASRGAARGRRGHVDRLAADVDRARWNGDEKADAFPVDVTIADANPSDFDALLLPGGVRNPDKLRTNNKAVLFAHAIEIAKKPIAAICHGPWLLVETGFVRDRKLTSWPSLKTDIVNGGGTWLDRAVVRDELLVTSRNPGDIPKFIDAAIALFAQKYAKTPHESPAATARATSRRSEPAGA